MMWPFFSGFPSFTGPSEDVTVEGARIADVSDLAKVHADAFAHSWTGDEFVRLMESENIRAMQCRRPATWFRSASKNPKGFVLARVAADEAEILTIAVARDSRGFGLGNALMRAMMGDLYADRIKHLFLEVDENNETAIALYRKLRFEVVGERKSYYAPVESDGDEEAARARALVMRADLR